MSPIALILFSLVCTVTGQTFQKIGMIKFGPIKRLEWRLLKIFMDPGVLVGTAALVLGAMLWLMVLSQEELSFAYPILSLGYVLVTIISALYFGERVRPKRWFGVLFIIVGVCLVMAHKTS